MKKIFLILTLLFCASLGFASEKQASQITLGMLPGGDPETVRSQAIELAKELQTQLEIPVNIYISKDYAGLIEAMKTKKVDFAFFSALTYVFAEKEVKTKVLLKKVWSEPFYYSALITKKNSGIKKVEQLKGKRVAFVDEKSASGYLYPQVMLNKKNLHNEDFKSLIYSGNHQASIRLLEQGEVDAAAVFSDDEKGEKSAWTKFATDKKQKYRILWISDPIPNDPFCVRQEFYDDYPKITHTLMFALIDIMSREKESHKYSEVLGTRDLMPATTKQYDPVREMVEALKIKMP